MRSFIIKIDYTLCYKWYFIIHTEYQMTQIALYGILLQIKKHEICIKEAGSVVAVAEQ